MTEPVSIGLGGGKGKLDGALAAPDGEGPFPAMLVLHEIFGLNGDMRRIADRFAANGYVAVAPDLYSHGNRALCLSRVLLAGMWDDAMRATLADIEAARQFLASQPRVDPARVAVVGFCLGGGFALLLGTRGGVRAAAVNYGRVPKDRDELRGVCPVIGSFGALDKGFLDDAKRLDDHLDALGVPHDVKVYDGAGHSFLSYDNAPAWLLRIPSAMHPGYSEEAAEDAWARMLAFFAEHV